jgi:hypothetical protein
LELIIRPDEFMASRTGTKDNPRKLKTPPLSSEYEMYLVERGLSGDF